MTSRPRIAVFVGALWLAGLAFATAASAATLRADFHFNGPRPGEAIGDFGEGNVFADESVDGGPVRKVRQFPLGNGFTLATGELASYSVVVLFRLDSVPAGRRRLLDFADGASDAGLYECDGSLMIELVSATPCLAAGDALEWAQVVFTRDGSSDEVRAYLDGNEDAMAVDALDVTALPAELRFFVDDADEHSGGAASRIRVYDGVLSPEEVGALDRVDTTAPVVALGAVPAVSNDPAPAFSGTAGDEAGDDSVTATVSRDGVPVATLPASRTGGSWTAQSPPLQDGTYTVHAEQGDGAGNVGTSQPVNFTIDTAAPETSMLSGPSGPTNDATPRFEFSSPGAEGYMCRVYDAADSSPPGFGACSSPRTLESLADGSYVFEASGVDAAGNQDASAATRAFRIDTAAPQTRLTAGPGDTTATNTTFLFSASEAARFSCRLDAGSWQPCDSPHSYTGLALGPHRFAVRATDEAGNEESTPAAHAWQVLKPGLVIPASAKQAIALAEGIVEMRKALEKIRLRRIARRGTVTLRGFDAPTAGTVEFRAKARLGRGQRIRRVVFLAGRRQVPAAGRYPVEAKLTQRGRRLARRRGSLRVELRLAFTDLVGRSLWATTVTTIKR